MVDLVHTVLQQALDEAGIESPFPIQTLNVKMEGERAEPLSQATYQSSLPKETV
jgi:hypothetical protein